MSSCVELVFQWHAETVHLWGRCRVCLCVLRQVQVERLHMHCKLQQHLCLCEHLCCIVSVFNAPPRSLRYTAVPPFGAEPTPGLCVPIGDSRPGLGASPHTRHTHQHDFHWRPRAGGAPSGKNKQTWRPWECKCTDPAHLTLSEYGKSALAILLAWVTACFWHESVCPIQGCVWGVCTVVALAALSLGSVWSQKSLFCSGLHLKSCFYIDPFLSYEIIIFHHSFINLHQLFCSD